ncbi:hypothetical protein [Xylophilus ampelinus]
MVRALLDNSKTQTRRVCKPAQDRRLSFVVEVPDPQERGQVYNGSHFGDEEGEFQFACPYGGRGDRLWVRESFAIEHCVEPYQRPPHSDGRPILHRPTDDIDCLHPLWKQAHYRATDPAPELLYEQAPTGGREKEIGVRWKPSIHMPRWASRILLELTDVRVERLQDISEADAIAEGCATGCMTPTVNDSGSAIYGPGGYALLWESIHGAGSWAANPWVWAVSFRRLEVTQ